jgi:peptidyl-tRNA hydrolase, PTH1 family
VKHRWIIGLGNPGAQYQYNRHNIGFMCLDLLSEQSVLGQNSTWKKKEGCMIYEGLWKESSEEIKVTLCKPMMYMNLSGQSIAGLIRFHKIPPSDILVIHDELDLSFGQLRLKVAGGSGGHNGLRDLIQHIGSDFWRLRFGIGHPGHKSLVSSYVLKDFNPQEQKSLENLRLQILQGSLAWAQGRLEEARIFLK